MKQHIPNILLAIGTATGALSGASARLPWREVSVQPGVEQEEFLAHDLTLGGAMQAEKGSRLDGELCTKLDSLGFTTVKVRSPAHPMASLPLAEAKGEVLAEAIGLPGQTQEISAGRIVDAALEKRAAAAGLTLVTHSAPPRLSEPITLPAELRSSTFLDKKTLEKLKAAGITTVEVKRTQPFAWQDWPGRWAFIISIFVMGVAVALKRSAIADKGESGNSLADIGEIKMNLLALAAGADARQAGGHREGLRPAQRGRAAPARRSDLTKEQQRSSCSPTTPAGRRRLPHKPGEGRITPCFLVQIIPQSGAEPRS